MTYERKQGLRAGATALTAVLAGILALACPATGQPAGAGPVSADPVDWTPHVLDGTVMALTQVGDVIIAGGSFTSVADAPRDQTYQRRNLFAFSARTGAVLSWNVEVDGAVLAAAAGPHGTFYIGGDFTRVGGQPHRGLAQLRLADARPMAGFGTEVGDGEVRVLRRSGAWLYAGGSFTTIGGLPRAGLARLRLDGTADPATDGRLEGTTHQQGRVNDLALTPDGRTMVVIGAFTSAAGRPRDQLAVFRTGDAGTSLSDWSTDAYRLPCHEQFPTYLRGVDISPDGRYFVVVTTGHQAGNTAMCNTAARYDLAGAGDHEPVWVNRTGGNSLLAVAVTATAVYVGGHQRWLDNPDGDKDKGPGAVDRPGIGAIDPTTGTAKKWNPTRARGVGVHAFLVTDRGLYVGSDTDELGHEYHGRLGMFPVGG